MLDLSRSIRGLLSGAVQQARQAEDEGEWARAAACWQSLKNACTCKSEVIRSGKGGQVNDKKNSHCTLCN